MSDTTPQSRWRPRFGIKTLMLFVALAATVCAVVVNWEYVPGTYYRDKSGFPHGTGWGHNYYENGGLMLKDYYRAGELIEQVWYKPDGGIFVISSFHRDGVNVGYYLRDDGSVRSMVQYRYRPTDHMYVADGTTVCYRTDGSVDHIDEYRDGELIEPDANK